MPKPPPYEVTCTYHTLSCAQNICHSTNTSIPIIIDRDGNYTCNITQSIIGMNQSQIGPFVSCGNFTCVFPLVRNTSGVGVGVRGGYVWKKGWKKGYCMVWVGLLGLSMVAQFILSGSG